MKKDKLIYKEYEEREEAIKRANKLRQDRINRHAVLKKIKNVEVQNGR